MSNVSLPTSIAGYTFKNTDLLRQALTHRSVEGAPHYERLEFLGDRILNLYVAEMLYFAFPDDTEGMLAKRYMALVRTETLAQLACTLDLPAAIIMSEGESKTGGRDKESILADIMESVLAALYLDSDAVTVQKVIQRLFAPLLTDIKNGKSVEDAKTRLQELLQADQHPLPVYTVIDHTGKDHDKTFVIEVSCALGTAKGVGRSKQLAGQAAAHALLAVLKKL